MKKLFLLIIASWATSCLPVRDTQSLSAPTSTTAFTEISQKLKNKEYCSITIYYSTLPGTVRVGAPAYCPQDIQLFAVVGFTAAMASTFLCYEISKTFKERVFAYAKGIGSANVVCAVAFLGASKEYPDQGSADQGNSSIDS